VTTAAPRDIMALHFKPIIAPWHGPRAVILEMVPMRARFPLFLIALALSAPLLSACGAETPTLRAANAAEYFTPTNGQDALGACWSRTQGEPSCY
jgi:hypothetical protein